MKGGGCWKGFDFVLDCFPECFVVQSLLIIPSNDNCKSPCNSLPVSSACLLPRKRHRPLRESSKCLPPRHAPIGFFIDLHQQVGSLDKSKKSVGTGLVGAPACGDVMKLQAMPAPCPLLCHLLLSLAICSAWFQIEVDASGVISNAVFKTFG